MWWKVELEEYADEVRKIDYGGICKWIELRMIRNDWIWQGIGLRIMRMNHWMKELDLDVDY